jgi:hypothetical protein
MNNRPGAFSPRRFRFVWNLLKALIAEQNGRFDRALQLVDRAGGTMPLRPSDRVWRALLLLRAQRIREAHVAFAALRDEFKGSDDADLQYLRHYCTFELSGLTPRSGQWSYEARKGKLIECHASLKRRFPMVTVDELHERIRPRR